MSSRAQRFGSRVGGWRSRSTPSFTPTNADFAAKPFSVSYEANVYGVRVTTTFPVLALNAEHAEAQGRLRLLFQGRTDVDALTLTDAREGLPLTPDTLDAMLQVECPEEYAERQRWFTNHRAAV
jgi:hypothetical protein